MNAFMLILLFAKKDSDSGFGLTILEYSRIVYYSVLPIPTLDQILFLSQSISDGFNKLRLGSQTMLATINFSKVFDSVWCSALFHKLISTGLPLCFAC